MSAIVAKKDITLRMVQNKVSTAFTKAFLESDYVNQMVDCIYDEVEALKLASISLNYIYRHLEYKKYKNFFKEMCEIWYKRSQTRGFKCIQMDSRWNIGNGRYKIVVFEGIF